MTLSLLVIKETFIKVVIKYVVYNYFSPLNLKMTVNLEGCSVVFVIEIGTKSITTVGVNRTYRSWHSYIPNLKGNLHNSRVNFVFRALTLLINKVSCCHIGKGTVYLYH